MKQTAVEWLVDELRKYGSPIPRQLEEQAKEMEKQQIVDSFNEGMNNSLDYFMPNEKISEAEQYYNETFKI
jgi:hypothetical protein